MKHLKLENSDRVALVDDADFERLRLYRWFIQDRLRYQTVYVRRFTSQKGKSTTYSLHREVTGAKRGEIVDHINGDGLDNRRGNLRLATVGQNRANSRKIKIGHSKYKGVTVRKGFWNGVIRYGGKTHHLGTFATEEDAARAYDKRAFELHGEFAKLNFPDGAK